MKKIILDISKILAKSFFKWLSTIAIGLGLSLMAFTIGTILVINAAGDGPGYPGAAHTGGLGAIMGVIILFSTDFWAMLLATLSLLVFPFLYLNIANKAALHGAVYLLWKNNMETWITEKFTFYVKKIVSKENSIAKNIDDKATVKARLINSIRSDQSTSKWQKKVLTYVLKKIKLEDIDTLADDEKVSDFITKKILDFVSDIGAPSNKFLIITLLIHLLLIPIALIF
ncbi:hypothetical protein [Fulvivirga sediminis]|uniref:Uncharacterized protein n=1 Tax=Fulvivirga sediminis TaxID=2803949 RepID=A0A937F9P0_9BACT|nr:hypothetical protein [Fulvivirga sediminis]MBL3658881.1 hypothetical protein [Fulvivirga sediminis]